MVIGKHFVWGHMGKTGGDSVHKMFACLPQKYIEYADDTRKPDKHFSFAKREADMGIDLSNSRKRILNIRRLPSWALSYGYHKLHRQGVPFDREKLLQGILAVRVRQIAKDDGTIEMITDYAHIDQILQNQMCGRVDYWIRTEYLAQDFISIVSQFIPISWWRRLRIKITHRNTNSKYDKDLSKHFNKQDLEQLYAACPFWTKIEKQCYGDIISL